MNIQYTNKIAYVAPIHIPTIWYEIEPMLIEGLKRTDDIITKEVIYHKLAVGEFLLWTVQQEGKLVGLALTEVGLTQNGAICYIFFVTGKGMKSWFEDLHDNILAWALHHHCVKMKALGRIGWLKFYKQKNWQVKSVEYSYTIADKLH